MIPKRIFNITHIHTHPQITVKFEKGVATYKKSSGKTKAFRHYADHYKSAQRSEKGGKQSDMSRKKPTRI